MTRPCSASTTARPTRRGACGSARSTNRASPRGRAVPLRDGELDRMAERHQHQQRPGLEPGRRARCTGPTPRRTRCMPSTSTSPPARSSSRRVFARFARARRAGRWPATAAGPTARRWTPKAPTGWRCTKARALLRLVARRPTAARGRAAGAVPDDAVLRRRRPEDAVHHHRARQRARPTNSRACRWSGCVLQMRVEVPGLPVNFATLSERKRAVCRARAAHRSPRNELADLRP